jgi:cyclic dehypoxanthinyl futalosine synthase
MSARIDRKEALRLLRSADLLELGAMADEVRKRLHPGNRVTFVVDRNVNYTNICKNRCTFCAFWRDESDPEGYVIKEKELNKKIEETLELGGTQILLQGGIHPGLNIDYYIGLLKGIKERYMINVHGFSPPEVCFIADTSDLTVQETLWVLRDAGLDSIPGGGAEILTDRVRRKLSPRKIGTKLWLKVMEEAHRMGMRTTATMMFGSVEKPSDIISHLQAIRDLQDRTGGFTAFIPWSFQPGNTPHEGKVTPATAVEYLRVLALSRVFLDNVQNIQASWVTQGLKMAQVALRFGANDMGSTMIEENVVAAAGVEFRVSLDDMVGAIKADGFKAAQRDTYYNLIKKY